MAKHSSGARVRLARIAVRQLRSLVRRSTGHLRPREARQLQEVLAEAVPETYGWARRMMKDAYGRGGAAAFREWGVAVKYHALHMRLLAELCPYELHGRREVIERLGELLREDRELSAFASELSARDAGPNSEPADAHVDELIAQRQQALRALARPLGRRLFADPTRAFAHRLETCLAEVPGVRTAAAPGRRQRVAATVAHLLRPTFT